MGQFAAVKNSLQVLSVTHVAARCVASRHNRKKFRVTDAIGSRCVPRRPSRDPRDAPFRTRRDPCWRVSMVEAISLSVNLTRPRVASFCILSHSRLYLTPAGSVSDFTVMP